MSSSRNTKILLATTTLAVFAAGVLWYVRSTNVTDNTQTQTNQTDTTTLRDEARNASQSQQQSIKDAITLQVPFTPQAPTGNWDQLHDEACEEASALMAAEYFNPTPGTLSTTTTTLLRPEFVEQEIARMTAWFDREYGYHLSTTTPQTARMIEALYGLKTELVRDFNEHTIKQALNDGKLVILPANGRLLGNPNYTAPGPIYHMLVITGYDSDGFITNDPGTRRGYNYRYSFDTLYTAAAEWNHTTYTTDTNIKQILIVSE